uniref:Uncharacterized protein n=1 Tax=Pseudomonas fluorescens TaxID=294 RepID=A0A6M5CFQ1_PSEFL|nr:hypothetical protein [Pseudomonas fluorescens]
MTPRRNEQGMRGYAPACCGRLCKSVPFPTLAVHRPYVTKDGSPTHLPGRAYGASTPRFKHEAASCGRGVLALSLGCDLARICAQAGEVVMRGYRVGHVSFRRAVGLYVLGLL